MHIIGLTGSIATGKSTVSQILATRNIPIVDADIIAKQILETGKPAYRKVVQQFGNGILAKNLDIDRNKLGEKIFKKDGERNKLNAITHPYIVKSIIWQIIRIFLAGHTAVVLDVPLLYEAKLDRICSKVIVVACSEKVQIQRLIARNPEYSKTHALERIRSQMPLVEKMDKADIVLSNDGELDELQTQIDEQVIPLLTTPKRQWFRIFAATSLMSVILYAILKYTSSPTNPTTLSED